MGIDTETCTSRPAPCGDLVLGIPGFRYEDLYAPDRLADLAQAFYAWLGERDASLAAEFGELRRKAAETANTEIGESSERFKDSRVLIEVAKHQSPSSPPCSASRRPARRRCRRMTARRRSSATSGTS